MTLRDYLTALLLTEAIETTVAVLLGFRKPREIAAVLLVNFVTHPLLHYYALLHEYYPVVPAGLTLLSLIEAGIVFVEWGLLMIALKERSKLSLFILSAAMNACSYAAGFFIMQAGA